MSNDKLAKYATFEEQDAEEVDRALDEIRPSIYLDLKEGENVVRVLPARIGTWPTFRVTSLHYIQLPGADTKIFFNCPTYELRQPCPACAEVQRLMGSHNPADKARARKYKATPRILMNVLNRNSPESGPKVLSVGFKIWHKIKELRKNVRAGGDMTLPETGYDLIITKANQGSLPDGGQRVDYDVFGDRANTPLAETAEEMEDILSRQTDLNNLVDCTVPEDLIEAWGAVTRTGRGAPSRTQEQRQAAGSSAIADARRANGKAAATPPAEYIEAEAEEVPEDPDDPSTWK